MRSGTKDKEAAELAYWRARRAEGPLEAGAAAYEWAFTTLFGLDRGFYAGKRVLDVGCGPRGSLEWADVVAERVGVDPLAGAYRELHTVPHAMSYVVAAAEALPFADGSFDVVAAFNSLDHVEDVSAAIAELGRVARTGAALLLCVDIGHAATVTEPHALDPAVLDAFAADWELADRETVARWSDNMLFNLGEPRPWSAGPGVLRARLSRR